MDAVRRARRANDHPLWLEAWALEASPAAPVEAGTNQRYPSQALPGCQGAAVLHTAGDRLPVAGFANVIPLCLISHRLEGWPLDP